MNRARRKTAWAAGGMVALAALGGAAASAATHGTGSIAAVSPGPKKPGRVEVELVSEFDALVPGRPAWVGLRMTHDPHWHTYWSNPGDAGLPPTLAWRLPAGFRAGAIEWPHPERIQVGALASYGYEGEHLLPVLVFVPKDAKPGQRVTLVAEASWLVCKESCLPEEATLALSLHVASASKAAAATRWAPRFAAARSRMPEPVEGARADATREGDTLRVVLRLPEAARGRTPQGALFFEQEDFVEPGVRPTLASVGDTLVWTSRLTFNGRKRPAAEWPAVWVPAQPHADGPKAVRVPVTLR